MTVGGKRAPSAKGRPVKIAGEAIHRTIVVVNMASGRAGPDAPEAATQILADAGLAAEVRTPKPPELVESLKGALAEKPDLLVLVAGDGTARLAATMCGHRGPLLAPLPGGTMNMLPHALYGARDWKTALKEALADGVVRHVGGGAVDDEAFFVAAILGAPALWADAREAVRKGRLAEAVGRARSALARTFTGRLRFRLNQGPVERAEALALITPLISKVLRDDATALEVSALDLGSAVDVFRLAAHALAGDWRADQAVTTRLVRKGEAFAAGRIPAVLDGEPVRLGRSARFSFRPNAFRALALEDPA